MTEKSLKYLSDILMAIELIEEFTQDISDFSAYERDRKTQSAVERQLVIIGEAINQFKKLESEILLQNDRQIVGFRNRLVHSYDSIDNSIVWVIISRYLNLLKLEINALVNS